MPMMISEFDNKADIVNCIEDILTELRELSKRSLDTEVFNICSQAEELAGKLIGSELGISDEALQELNKLTWKIATINVEKGLDIDNEIVNLARKINRLNKEIDTGRVEKKLKDSKFRQISEGVIKCLEVMDIALKAIVTAGLVLFVAINILKASIGKVGIPLVLLTPVAGLKFNAKNENRFRGLK